MGIALQGGRPDGLVEQLRDLADPARADGMLGYLKTSRIEFLTVRHPEVRRLAKEHAGRLPESQFLSFLEGLWRDEVFKIRRADHEEVIETALRLGARAAIPGALTPSAQGKLF